MSGTWAEKVEKRRAVDALVGTAGVVGEFLSATYGHREVALRRYEADCRVGLECRKCGKEFFILWSHVEFKSRSPPMPPMSTLSLLYRSESGGVTCLFNTSVGLWQSRSWRHGSAEERLDEGLCGGLEVMR